jgi:hypothetical protein
MDENGMPHFIETVSSYPLPYANGEGFGADSQLASVSGVTLNFKLAIVPHSKHIVLISHIELRISFENVERLSKRIAPVNLH